MSSNPNTAIRNNVDLLFMTFSVIIPSYRSIDNLEILVKQLAALLLAEKDTEVVIVNDSRDPEHAIVYQQRLKPYLTENIRYVETTATYTTYGSPGRPRNVGISHARGEYYIVIDTDMTITPEFIQGYRDCIEKDPTAIVCTQIKPPTPITPFEHFLAHSNTYFVTDVLPHLARCSKMYFFTGCAMIPKKVLGQRKFQESEQYGYEDFILAHEFEKQGYSFLYNALSTVVHNERPELPLLCWKKYTAATHVPEIVAKYPEIAKELHFSSILKFFPIKKPLPQKFLQKCDEAISLVPPLSAFFYKLLLGISFLSGISKGMAGMR